MQVDITGITEDDVVLASVMLDDMGFEYDKDYTTIYGAGWSVTGLRITNVEAANIITTAFARPAFPPNTIVS